MSQPTISTLQQLVTNCCRAGSGMRSIVLFHHTVDLSVASRLYLPQDTSPLHQLIKHWQTGAILGMYHRALKRWHTWTTLDPFQPVLAIPINTLYVARYLAPFEIMHTETNPHESSTETNDVHRVAVVSVGGNPLSV